MPEGMVQLVPLHHKVAAAVLQLVQQPLEIMRLVELVAQRQPMVEPEQLVVQLLVIKGLPRLKLVEVVVVRDGGVVAPRAVEAVLLDKSV